MELAVMEKVCTAEQYLERERNTQREDGGKYQFYKNKRILMAGGTRKHDKIVSNMNGTLFMAIADDEVYDLYTSEMKISCITKIKQYFYSDGLVVKGKAQFEDNRLDILTNPTLIIEVLSKSTEHFDRTNKFEEYRHLESFEEYILVSQKEPCVEHFYKNSYGEWVEGVKLKNLDAVLTLKNLPFSLPLKKIYQRVDFTEADD